MTTLLNILIQNALMTTVLAVVVGGICLFVRRPAIRNVLWLVVLFRLFLPPIWTVPIWTTTEPSTTTTDTVAESDDMVTEATWPRDEPIWEEVPATALVDWSVPIPNEATTTEVSEATPTMELAPSWNWVGLLGWCWIIGSMAMFFLATRRIGRFHQAIRCTTLAPQEWQEEVRQVSNQLGFHQAPEVLLAPGQLPPLLWQVGWFPHQAKLIFPGELMRRLTPDQRQSLFAHELAHLRRGDPWVRWLELLAVVLYWWYLPLHWIRGQLRQAEEECCDASVAALQLGRRAYAEALLETVSFLDETRPQAMPHLASGVAPVRQLQRRIGVIMSANPTRQWTRFSVFTVLCFALGALAIGPKMTLADEEDEGGRPKKEEKRKTVAPKEKEFFKDKNFSKKEDAPMPREKGKEFKDFRGDQPTPKASREEIAEARREVERARKEMSEMMERMMKAERKLAELEGRPFQGGGFGFGFGGRFGPFGGDGEPKDGRGRTFNNNPLQPREGDWVPKAPTPPKDPERPMKWTEKEDPAPKNREIRYRSEERERGDDRDMRRELDELRRSLEELRREIRRNREPDRK